MVGITRSKEIFFKIIYIITRKLQFHQQHLGFHMISLENGGLNLPSGAVGNAGSTGVSTATAPSEAGNILLGLEQTTQSTGVSWQRLVNMPSIVDQCWVYDDLYYQYISWLFNELVIVLWWGNHDFPRIGGANRDDGSRPQAQYCIHAAMLIVAIWLLEHTSNKYI